jgi:predicted nucleotidyltransferase
MGLIETLRHVLRKYPDQVKFSYLFGSTAGGQDQPLSDIDIAVYLSNRKENNFLDLKLSLYADFCRALKRNDIDILVLNTSTNIILLEDIIKTGVVLSEAERGEALRRDFELKVLHQAIDFRNQRKKIMGE